MSDKDLLIDRASSLSDAQWQAVFENLDEETRSKLVQQLDNLKEVKDVAVEVPTDDTAAGLAALNKKMSQIMSVLKAHKKKFDRFDMRLDSLEIKADKAANVDTSAKSKALDRKKRAKKVKAGLGKKQDEDAVPAEELKQRKHNYRFGSRNLQVLLPSEGVPSRKEAKLAPQGKLELAYIHGYNGNDNEQRINMYLTPDGNYLIYYLAAAGIVLNLTDNTQNFFLEHNDDLTCICIDPRSGSNLVASGQKDPKDEPGQGKDLPKIWIWDYKKMKKVQLIDNVCWGKISKLAWSETTGFLYCVCGDDDQTLKVFDSAEFGKPQKKKKDKKKKPNQCSMDELVSSPVYREKILGFVIRPKPDSKSVEEMVFFGARKFSYGTITKGKKGLDFKVKAVAVSKLKKDGEKQFTCCEFLPDGQYLVGSSSGAVYICKGQSALSVMGTFHSKSVGGIIYEPTENKIYSSGYDRTLKRWAIGGGAAPADAGDKKAGKKGSDKKAAGKKGADKKGGDKKAAKKGKKADPFSLEWSTEVDIAGSDLVLQPKAMQLDAKNGRIYVGTKTNQIMTYEMKSEEASVLVDGHDGAIWGLCTHPENRIFATGGYDNAVKIWDADTLKCTWTYEFEERKVVEDGKEKMRGYEICSGAWSPDGKCLVFGTEDSNLAVFQYVNESEVYFQEIINIPPKSKNAEVEAVSYLRFSPDGELLAAAHMDANLYIFTIEGAAGGRILLNRWSNPMPHVAAPTNVQFSEDGKYVKTLTRDYEVAHWRLNRDNGRGKFVPSIPDPDKVIWGDDPLIAGWDVEGLYQPGWDGTDLNDATLTSDGKLVVSGDDYGKVRLHNYPAIAPEANRCYGGHAEFVVGVEFLRDDSQLITCGGEDMAIFQWRLHKAYEPDDEPEGDE